MNPKHAPALSTIPDEKKKVHSADIVECLKSIKQLEQLQRYTEGLVSQLEQLSKSSVR